MREPTREEVSPVPPNALNLVQSAPKIASSHESKKTICPRVIGAIGTSGTSGAVGSTGAAGTTGTIGTTTGFGSGPIESHDNVAITMATATPSLWW